MRNEFKQCFKQQNSFFGKYNQTLNEKNTKMQYKKKLTDIFLRKDDKPKKQPIIEKPKIQQFDESYFEAQLMCDNINTSLMKISATIKKGHNSGQQILVKCRWYTKNQFDFKEIQEVKGNCFQPCLQDVGNIICVQLEPQIQGMQYTGITIMKESDQLKLDKRLETHSNQYFISRHIQMEGKLEAMYSQNPVYENYEYPLEVIIQLRDKKVSFKDKKNRQIVVEYQINEEFPQVDFIRKSFNSVIFTCNQKESMKLSLTNNFNRDLFTLILRSIPSRISLPNSVEQLFETQITRHKSLIESSPSQETTKYILKIDELNKQIKNLKRINEQITTNYHLERNTKINLQNQIQKVKSILQKTNQQHKECKPLHTKIKQVTEQNKFFFGQISLLKNQLKQKNQTIKQLKTQISTLKNDKNTVQDKILQLSLAPTTKIQNLQKELQNAKSSQEKLQNENDSLKQTINQLQNQKNLLKKKLTSIVSQKSLPVSPVKSASKIGSVEDLNSTKDSTTQIKCLKMQISNLQMLLKHKSGEKGGEMIGMQLLVNGLTEKIAQKEMEIESLKKINKEMSKNVSAFTLNQVL